MITVHWRHVVLDPVVFTTYRSNRVARVNARSGVSGGAFPVVASGMWSDAGFTWTPDSPGTGRAEPSYLRGAYNCVFSFWSVVARTATASPGGGGMRTVFADVFYDLDPPPVVGLTVTAVVEATAWYVWDFGGGPGAHGAYLDAFDVTEGQFIPDDFVDVVPDSSLTPQANDGLLPTATLDKQSVVARDPTGDVPPPRYFFREWRALVELEVPGSNPPSIQVERITLHQNNVINAVAFYEQRQSGPFQRVFEPREWTYIIGNLADGPLVIFGPFGPPRPIGPWDPTVLKALGAALQKVADDIRVVLEPPPQK